MTATALLERDEELARIERLLGAAAGGEGGVLTVEGGAGAGKTALLAAAAGIAERRQMRVLRARGGEYERDFPYGVIRQLFEPPLADTAHRAELLTGSAALARPAFEPGTGTAEGGAVEHGLYWLAADLADAAPLLLAVDDAQWADVASLQALAYLARRLDGLPVALALTVRTGEPGSHDDLLDELRQEAAGRTIEPPPLSIEATAALVASETGAESSPRFVKACREATAGNPFLLVELLRALGAAEVEPTEESIECLTQIAVAGLADSVRTRLGRLGGRSIDVARAVAVLEPNAEPRLIAALGGVPATAVTEAGERLIAAGLLADSASPSFVHPLIRDAVLSEIPAPRQAALHAQAARLLWEDGAEPDTVAAHLLLAEPGAEAWVVAQLRSAAAAASGRGVAETSVRYLRRALREALPADERLEVSRELGVALLRANDPEGLEVLGTVRTAKDEGLWRAEIAGEMARSLGLRGGNKEAAALLEESLVGIPDPQGELGLMLRGWLQQQVVWGLEHLPRAVETFVDPSPATMGGRFVLQGIAILHALGLGTMRRGEQAVEAMLEDPSWVLGDALAGLPPQGLLLTLVLADRGDRVAGMFDLAIEGSRQRGTIPGIAGGHGARAFAHLAEGDLREAQADGETCVELQQPFGLVGPLAVWSSLYVQILLARGELRVAEELMEDLWGGRGRVPGVPGSRLLCTRGELRTARGRFVEARHDFLAAAERIAWLPYPNPEAHPWRIGLARCELALGNEEEARELAAEAVELARMAGCARGIGISLRVQGTVVGGAEGIELLGAAAEVLGGTRARLHHAEALVEHGAALRRANFRKEARQPLREGLELAHRCGAVPLEARARTELSATGARPRKAVYTGVEALTPSEHRVARMASEGMSNREIAQSLTVTPKTVETHLRHVFQKLDISRRAELSRVLGGCRQP
ncbi:MAG: helix-turn-helix transcriptional regulator [Solirubrobacterales bacterium]